jgi:hypothetical protein
MIAVPGAPQQMNQSAEERYPGAPTGDGTEEIEIQLAPVEVELIGDAEPDAPPPAASSSARPDLIVIEAEDLPDVPDYPALPSGGYPAVDVTADVNGKLKGAAVRQLTGSLVLQMMVAGAIGGFLAWAVQEPGMRAHALGAGSSASGPLAQLVYTCKFGAIMGAFIGLSLGAAEGVVLGAWSRAATGAGLGFATGLLGGAIGGVLGQTVFRLLLGGAGTDLSLSFIVQTVAARSIGWAAVGALVGMGPGVMGMAGRKITNGAIGGAAGGFVGGLLFDGIDLLFQALLGPPAAGQPGIIAGSPSRLVGITTLGLCTGLGIGLVEEMRKEAWLVVVGGPLSGKQFVLYKHETIIGRDLGADIPLVKDTAIGPGRCIIEAVGAVHVLRCTDGAQASVNSRPVHSQRLGDGDLIGFGATELQYRVRPLDFDRHQV